MTKIEKERVKEWLYQKINELNRLQRSIENIINMIDGDC